jgi:hypothetical protein
MMKTQQAVLYQDCQEWKWVSSKPRVLRLWPGNLSPLSPTPFDPGEFGAILPPSRPFRTSSGSAHTCHTSAPLNTFVLMTNILSKHHNKPDQSMLPVSPNAPHNCLQIDQFRGLVVRVSEIMWSLARLPALPWGFFLEGEDPHGEHGLGSLAEFRFKALSGTSHSYITIHLIGTT